jgi:hypothetical protein
MPGITYWNRLEPTSRTDDLVGSLGARIHDPMWFLTRQWQFGEFRAEDAGSPAWIEVDSTAVRMTAFSARDHTEEIGAHVPLERLAGATMPFDLATSVDLGQTFESMLGDVTLAKAFRAAYPVAGPSASDTASGDVAVVRFRTMMAGRACDGAALFRAATAALPGLPLVPVVPLAKQAKVAKVLLRWVGHVRELFGGTPDTPSPAWNSSRMAYEYDVSVGSLGGYGVRPGHEGEATWEAFSGRDSRVAVPTVEQAEQTTITRLPAGVRFRGMPARRFWDFASSVMDVGAVEAEPRDLAKLVLMDLLMLHGDQWFIVPIEQRVGTVMSLDAVLVRDVFGVLTLIPPAASPTWSMFQTSGTTPVKGLLLAATAAASAQYGSAIEEVRFVRDDAMNVVWAIDEIVTGGLGQPMRGDDVAARRTVPAPEPPPSDPRYVLRPPAPEHWTPYIPVATGEGVAFERADSTGSPYRIAEEDLRNSGVRVQRVVARARGVLGHTFLWVSARKSVAPSETSSPPRFDAVVVG